MLGQHTLVDPQSRGRAGVVAEPEVEVVHKELLWLEDKLEQPLPSLTFIMKRILKQRTWDYLRPLRVQLLPQCYRIY